MNVLGHCSWSIINILFQHWPDRFLNLPSSWRKFNKLKSKLNHSSSTRENLTVYLLIWLWLLSFFLLLLPSNSVDNIPTVFFALYMLHQTFLKRLTRLIKWLEFACKEVDHLIGSTLTDYVCYMKRALCHTLYIHQEGLRKSARAS